MIDYYSIDQENFSQNKFKNEEHIELIKCLINRLFISNFRVVSDSENTTALSLKESFKYIKSTNTKKSLQKKFQKLVLNHKIRKSKYESIKHLNAALSKYKYYHGEIVFEEDANFNNNNLLIERNSDHIMQDLQLQSKGIIFNELENDDPLIKIMLGSTHLRFGVFNFIDNILYSGHGDDQTFYQKKTLSECLEFFMKIFIQAQSDELNFFHDNDDQKKLIIYCSTKTKIFDSRYRAKIDSAMKDFYKKDLSQRMYINSFVENGGKIQVYVFPNLDFDNNENIDREELHERFFATQNGIFSLSKDLDIFKWNNENKKYERRPIKFGYYSDFHNFAVKSKNSNFKTSPHIINLEN